MSGTGDVSSLLAGMERGQQEKPKLLEDCKKRFLRSQRSVKVRIGRVGMIQIRSPFDDVL